MHLLAWLWAAPLAIILVVGGICAARYTAPAEAPSRTWGLVPRLAPAFGRISGCILVLAAGTGMIIALVWPVGYGARNFDAQDHSVYNWVFERSQTHWLHSAMRLLTQMSNNRQTQVVAAISLSVLTVVWFFRRRGLLVLVPAVLIMTAYELEHQLQHTLKLLAHRTGPVPTDLGAFPSGGCARIISVYGLIIYLTLRVFGKTRSKTAVVAWTLLVAATFTEAFSRLYLGKHWISDIFGGLVFGAILLAVLIVATRMLDRPDRVDDAAAVSTGATLAEPVEPVARFAPTTDQGSADAPTGSTAGQAAATP